MAQLREYATAAGLKAGDRLPPERELAERLGVSRASVKQAIVVLEVQGLVDVRHGGGMYLLRDTLDIEPVDVLVERRRRLPDVLDAREALETKLAELAALRRTDDDLGPLADLAHDCLPPQKLGDEALPPAVRRPGGNFAGAYQSLGQRRQIFRRGARD